MGYAEDQLAVKQKNLQDYLDENRAGIDPNIVKTRDYLAGQDVLRAKNTQDILGGTASKYGIDPAIVQGGADFVAQQEPAFQAKRNAQLSQIRMKNISENLNKTFNQKMDEYQAAGYSYQQAQQFARQWQADQVAQTNSADVAAQGRSYAQQKADISARYQNQTNDLKNEQPPNPYEAALTRALFGLGTSAISYKIINGKKVPVSPNGQLSTDISAPVSSQNSYGPQEQPYGPYNPYSY